MDNKKESKENKIINTVQFDLINNAKDSLHHAVNHLTNSEGIGPGDIKLVIREVSQVVELLFKERLRQIHPAFIIFEKYLFQVILMDENHFC